jgi:signal transduction histidine kinase
MILFLGVSQFEDYRILRFKQLQSSTNNKLYDQLEKERSLIAFELHDDIAQKLAIIKRYFSSKNSIDKHMNLMEKYSSDVIKRVRYLSRMLKAPDNPDVSFKDYLETLFSDFNVLSEYRVNRKTVGLNALKLEPSAALHIYRIIQEILTNSRIHSDATEINLLLVYSHPTLNIQYSDNGKGFDPYLVYRKGIGLDSIKYRLEILQGEYTLNSNEGEGTDISIDIPIELCEIS